MPQSGFTSTAGDPLELDGFLLTLLKLKQDEFTRILPNLHKIIFNLLQNGSSRNLFLVMLRLLHTRLDHVEGVEGLPFSAVLLFIRIYFTANATEITKALSANATLPLLYAANAAQTLNQFINSNLHQFAKSAGKGKGKPNDWWLSVHELLEVVLDILRVWGWQELALKLNISSLLSNLMVLYSSTKKTEPRFNTAFKVTILEIVDSLFSEILHLIQDSGDGEAIFDQSLLNRICDVLHMMLEDTPTHHDNRAVVYLEDASLLLDYEIMYGITEHLKALAILTTIPSDPVESAYGLIGTKLEATVVALEGILLYSGNADLHKLKQLHRMKQTLASGGEDTPMPSSTPPSYQDQAADAEDISFPTHYSQIVDLFPTFTQNFVKILLKEYSNDPELVIMAVIEEALPEWITILREKMENGIEIDDLRHVDGDTTPVYTGTLAPQSILATRANIYDGDSYDAFGAAGFSAATALIHQKAEDKAPDATEEEIERVAYLKEQKESILATGALVEVFANAGEEDFDEYDDTYATQDIVSKGVYKTTNDDGEEFEKPHYSTGGSGVNPKYEEYLCHLYANAPSVFHPSSRGSRERGVALRLLKGWDDGQLEGWAIMMNRNPERDRVLERYEFRGNKHTSWWDLEAKSVLTKKSWKNESQGPEEDSPVALNPVQFRPFTSTRGGRGGGGGDRGGRGGSSDGARGGSTDGRGGRGGRGGNYRGGGRGRGASKEFKYAPKE